MGFSLSIPDGNGQLATRAQLLEAAGEVFAESGFRAATVRAICERAGANIAAVNYHFGDKERLYHAVLQETYRAALRKYPADLGLRPNASPEDRLLVFVRSFLLRILSEGPSARHGKLMAREMMEPTGALEVIVKEGIQPMAHLLDAIVTDLLGPAALPETVRLCSLSVVGQVLYYRHCRPVLVRVAPRVKYDRAGIEKLAAHITDFSVAAIRNLRASPARKTRLRRNFKA